MNPSGVQQLRMLVDILLASYWGGNSTKGPIFMIINTMSKPQEMFFDLTENWAIRAGRQYTVRDLWAHKDIGVAVR